jgi:hypothetical protein
MHGGFERPAISLVQRCLHGGFDDPIQFVHIHVDPAPGGCFFPHDWLRSSRKRGVSG